MRFLLIIVLHLETWVPKMKEGIGFECCYSPTLLYLHHRQQYSMAGNLHSFNHKAFCHGSIAQKCSVIAELWHRGPRDTTESPLLILQSSGYSCATARGNVHGIFKGKMKSCLSSVCFRHTEHTLYALCAVSKMVLGWGAVGELFKSNPVLS